MKKWVGGGSNSRYFKKVHKKKHLQSKNDLILGMYLFPTMVVIHCNC